MRNVMLVLLLALAGCTQETNIVGPDCHATASASGGSAIPGTEAVPATATPGAAQADSGCSGSSVSTK